MEELLNLGLDIPSVIIYIMGGIFAKKYVKLKSISTTYTTLIIGTLGTLAYVGAMYLDGVMIPITKILMSYAIATSFYELILKQILKRMGENKGTYDCTEMTDSEFQNFDVATMIAGDMVYVGGVLKVATLTSDNTITITDNYIGSRPPKKPTRE